VKKVLIYIILVIIVSMVACGSKEQNPDITKIPNVNVEDKNVVPSEYINNLSIIYPVYKWGDYEAIDNWQKYIKEKFDKEIYIDYSGISPENLLEVDPTGILYLSYQRGQVYQFNTDILDYSKAHLAYDLSDYYEYYGWDQYVNGDYIDALTIDGAIYAVPTIENKYAVPRYYNAEILNKLNLNVPETLSEFYDYLRRSKDNYEGELLYYPLCISRPYLAQSTSDIMRAYGVYFNTEFNTTVSFNPLTDSFEDGVFSDNSQEALEFLRNLIGEDLMAIYGYRYMFDPAIDQTRNVFIENLDNISKDFASEYRYIYSANSDDFNLYLYNEDKQYNSVNGYCLTGINDKFVCEVRSDLSFYLFPKNIENINETVYLFNNIFTDDDYSLDFTFGIENIDYRIINDEIYTFLPEKGNFTDLKPIKPNSLISQGLSYNGESLQKIESLRSSMIYVQNVFNQIFTRSTNVEAGYFRFNDVNGIEAFLDSNILLEDSIKQYKTNFIRMGAVSVLEEINGRMGKTTTYNYRSN